MIQLHCFILPQCSGGLVDSIGSVGMLIVANRRTDQLTTGPRTLSRRRHPDLAILSNHLIDRKMRANSQEEVTPQKAFFPDANKI